MFLHSGASLHGHEYSKPPSPGAQALHRRSPLLRSPFGPPLRTSSAPPKQTQHRLRSSLQQRRPEAHPSSPLVDETVVRFLEPPAVDGIELGPAFATATAASSVTKGIGSCSDAEKSDLDESTSSSPVVKPSRRRLPRRIDTFIVARPPPRLVRKRILPQIRPKLLLQLHQVSAAKRPTPVLDVFPAATIVGPVVRGRLAVRFPRVFGVGRRGTKLGTQDVIIFRSEKYCGAPKDGGTSDLEEPSDDGSLSRRDLVAVLSPLKRQDRTDIVLSDGKVWTAEPLHNGTFEFTHTDDRGVPTTARWVRRSVTSSPTSPWASGKTALGSHFADPNGPLSPLSLSSMGIPEYRYTFSVIDPASRQHPVMATLTHDALNINETYTTVAPKVAEGVDDNAEDMENEESGLNRLILPVDAGTRRLISITALWITLRLGGIMPAGDNAATRVSATGTPSDLAGDPLVHRQKGYSPPMPQSPGFVRQQRQPMRRRAISTGAAYMQSRIQLSDASDSGRSSCRIRPRAGRMLSDSFSWRRSDTAPATLPADAELNASPPSLTEDQPLRNAPAVSRKHKRSASVQVLSTSLPRRPQHGKRVQSAYHGTAPAMPVDNEGEGADLAGLAQRTNGVAEMEEVGDEHPPEAMNNRWKRLGQWMRRFGR